MIGAAEVMLLHERWYRGRYRANRARAIEVAGEQVYQPLAPQLE